jgi:hypothetical protein
MSLITDSEREDFKRCIVEADLFVEDFKLTEQKDADGPKDGYFRTGTVTVTYSPPTSAAPTSTPTEIVRIYRAGVFPPWPVEFERELKLNAFKTR